MPDKNRETIIKLRPEQEFLLINILTPYDSTVAFKLKAKFLYPFLENAFYVSITSDIVAINLQYQS